MAMAFSCPERGDIVIRGLVSLLCRGVTILGCMSQALLLSTHPKSFPGMSWKSWDHP